MQKEKTVLLWVIAAVVLSGLFVAFQEHQRKVQLQPPTDPAEQPGAAANSPAAPPSFFPTYSGTFGLEPGKVATIPANFNGPLTLRIMVHSDQPVLLAVVSKAQAAGFSTQAPLANMMESLKCANSGKSSVTLSCELTGSEKYMVVVVGDTRDRNQVLREDFNNTGTKKPSVTAYSVTVDIFIATPSKQ